MKSTRLQLALLFIAAFLLRWLHDHKGLGNDSYSYLTLMRNFSHGILGEVTCGSGIKHYHQSLFVPIVSIFSGLSDSVHTLYQTALIVSALFGAGTVIVAYFLAKEFIHPRSAMLSAILVAILPQLVWYDSFVLTEPMFVLFTLLGLFYGLRSWQRPTYKNALLCGLFWGLATWTRINGVLLFFFWGLTLLAFKLFAEGNEQWTWKRILQKYGATLALGILVYTPMMTLLSLHRGHLTISPKDSGIIATRGTYVGQPVQASGSDLDVAEWERNGRQGPKSVMEYYLKFPKTAARVTFKNLRDGNFDDTLRHLEFPNVFILLLGIAFFFIASKKREWRKIFWLTSGIWIVGFYLTHAFVLNMLVRHYLHLYALMAIAAGWGLRLLWDQNIFQSNRRLVIVSAIVIGVLALHPFLHHLRLPSRPGEIPPSQNWSREEIFRYAFLQPDIPGREFLHFGASQCRQATYAPEQTEAQIEWANRIQKHFPLLIACDASTKAQSTCSVLFHLFHVEKLEQNSPIGDIYQVSAKLEENS